MRINLKYLAERFGIFWVIFGSLPTGTYLASFLKYLQVGDNIIIPFALLLIALQIFSIFIVIKYTKETFGFVNKYIKYWNDHQEGKRKNENFDEG